MDMTDVRKYIATKLMETTLAWNTKESVFPVMPPDLTEKQKIVWDLLTKSNTLGNLSSAQSKALRDVCAELLGSNLTVVDDSRRIDTATIPPFVILTSLKSDVFRAIAGGAEAVPVMKKATGDWVAPSGKSSPAATTHQAYIRIPTLEEVDMLITNVPDEFLSVMFAGLLPLKFSKDDLAYMHGEVVKVTKALFEGRPEIPTDAKTAKLYLKSRSYSTEARDLVFYAADLKWDAELDKKLQAMDDTELKVPQMACAVVNGEPNVYVNNRKFLTKKEIKEHDEPLMWGDITEPADEQITAACKSSNSKYLFAMMPQEFRTKVMEEVKLE